MLKKSMILIIALLFVTTAGPAVAGEKSKWRATSLTTETKQIEVGDVEGHVLMLTKSKQLYILPDGNKLVGVGANSMDINPKKKQFSLTGCGWAMDKDGDKQMRTHEGKLVGKDHWKGTWKYVGGTGKYEGIKGGGTWDSYSMGKGFPSYLEVEVEREMI